MLTHSLSLSENSDIYRTNVLQVYMATCAVELSADQCFHIANPGAGKTFAILLAANYNIMADTTRKKKVIIYSMEEIVVEQLKKKSLIFPTHSSMLITNVWDIDSWMSHKDAVFFFDEGE